MRKALLLLALAACQVPYGTPRQALEGDRVAALTVAPDGDGWRPAAWLVADGRPWVDARADLAWGFVAAPEDVDALGPEDTVATGPWPILTAPATAEPRLLAVIARFPSGSEARAVVALPEAVLPPLDDLTLAVLPDRPLDDATEEVLALDARRAEQADPATFVPEGTWARLAAVPGEGDAPSRLRWMATGGTFLELDDLTTDWAPARLLIDDLDVEESTQLGPGPVTFLALALDEQGGNVARAEDLFVGEPQRGVRFAGRFLPADAAVAPGLVRGTLTADDASPTGLTLADPTPVDASELSAADPYGTEALACAGPTAGPFDPSWLFDGRCARADVVGAVVVGRAE